MKESINSGEREEIRKKESGFHSPEIEPKGLTTRSIDKLFKHLLKCFSKIPERFTKKFEKKREKYREDILKSKTGFVSGQSQDRIARLLRSTENRVTTRSPGFKFSPRMRIPVLASKNIIPCSVIQKNKEKKESGFQNQVIEPKITPKSRSNKDEHIFKSFPKNFENASKNILLPILIILLTIIISNNVLALGIAPSSSDVTFTPDSKQVVDIAIINNDRKDMTVVVYADGELAKFISIPEPLIQITSSQPEVKTKYVINMPASLEKQGLHETNIVVREIPKAANGETQITASFAIISKLKLFVPYTGRYAEIKLMAPHFETGKQNNFAVEVNNLGTDKILTGYVIIDIYGPLNNNVKTLKSKEFSLESKQKKMVVIPWTPDIGSGEYVAEATLVYDELNAKDKKTFTLGELSIEIISISVDKFSLGGIAQFDLIVANNWNTPINDVYAVTTVTDKDGKEYLRFKTASVSVPAFGREKLEAYWPTSKVTPGPYKLDIALNYLGKVSKKVFDINVEQNRILISAAAVSPAGQSTIMKVVYILIILVIALIIVNAVMFLRNRKKGFMFLSLFLLLFLLTL